jgi:hypothetical protein
MLTLTTRLAALCGAFAFTAIVAACGQQQGAVEKAGEAETGAYESTAPGAPSPTEGPLEGQPTTASEPMPGATPSQEPGKTTTEPMKEPAPSQPKQP